MHFDDKNSVVSSSKYINLECVKQECYVIYVDEKSNGPKSDPCGTPHWIY